MKALQEPDMFLEHSQCYNTEHGHSKGKGKRKIKKGDPIVSWHGLWALRFKFRWFQVVGGSFRNHFLIFTNCNIDCNQSSIMVLVLPPTQTNAVRFAIHHMALRCTRRTRVRES